MIFGSTVAGGPDPVIPIREKLSDFFADGGPRRLAAGLKAWRGVSTVACAPKTATVPYPILVCAGAVVFEQS